LYPTPNQIAVVPIAPAAITNASVIQKDDLFEVSTSYLVSIG
jgi:hypothetical protein